MKSLKPGARGEALINTRGVTQKPKFEPKFFDPARAVTEGVCLTKPSFNWVVPMQARCLFSDQLQWDRKLGIPSMVRWLCATSDAESGRPRHTILDSSSLYEGEKEVELRQRR